MAAAPVGSGPPPTNWRSYWGGSTWHCDWSMTDEPLTVTVTEPQIVATGSAPAGPANVPKDAAASTAASAIRRTPLLLCLSFLPPAPYWYRSPIELSTACGRAGANAACRPHRGYRLDRGE